jgi:hypothetical protein
MAGDGKITKITRLSLPWKVVSRTSLVFCTVLQYRLQLISSQLISFGGQSSAGSWLLYLLQGQNEDVDIPGHQYRQFHLCALPQVTKPTW